jgi:hypothetical protein
MKRRFVLPVVLVLAAGVPLLVPRPIQAQVPGYKVQSVAKIGDTIGDLTIAAVGSFGVSALNDSGQLVFVAANKAGGDILFQYSSSDGRFTTIVAGGRDAPGGKWPRSVGVWTPVQINQQGDLVFQAGSGNLATYRWDHQSGKVSIVAAKGMPAVNDLAFSAGGDVTTPAINDFGEIAFQARFKDSTGATQRGIFFLGRDNKLVPVLLPGQTVDGVGAVQASAAGGHLTLNNAGVVCFHARRPGDKNDSLFVWENGTITPVALLGGDAPGGGKFVFIGWGMVNNKNRNVLFGGNLDGNDAHWGYYARIDGQLVAIAVPGKEMPGGGKFAGAEGSCPASSTGETMFTARLEGGDLGAYRVDADGKHLSLIVRNSDLGGKIVDPNSYGMAINGKGQVALPVRFTGDRVDTLVLLTPTVP